MLKSVSMTRTTLPIQSERTMSSDQDVTDEVKQLTASQVSYGCGVDLCLAVSFLGLEFPAFVFC